MYKFITIYEIPSNYQYVEKWNPFKTWKQLTHIKYDIPCVIIFNEDFKGYSFIVCYRNQMQTTGGSGCCNNPGYNNAKSFPEIPQHMSKPIIYNTTIIWQRICSIKYGLVTRLYHGLPMFYWDVLDYQNDMYGLFAGKLDLIGLGKADISILQSSYGRKQKLLTY